MTHTPFNLTIASSLALACSSLVGAQTWNLSGSGDWNTAANWNPQSVPDGVGASASFISTVQGGTFSQTGTISLSAPITLGHLTVDMGFAGPSIFFWNETITLDNGGGADVTMYTNATLSVQINSDIVLMGNLVSDWNASNGQISGSISGDYGITQDAGPSGRLKLWSVNTYTGETVVLNGRISIQDASGLGDHAAGTFVHGNSQLIMENLGTPTISGEHVTLVDGGFLVTRPCTWAEAITIVNAGRIAPWFDDYEMTMSGQISGDRFIRESARSNVTSDPTLESMVTLTNVNNDYTGGTEIRGGVLRIGDDAVLGQAGTSITFDIVGFSEGRPSLATIADVTIPRDIVMNDDGWLRADLSTTGTYTGVISGSRALTVGYLDWTGTVELAGANTYTGDTTIMTGTLLASNTTGSATGAGNVIVQSGATLGGTGFISGIVSIADGATIAPGASAGVLTVNELNLAPTAQTSIEIGGTASGAFDQISVNTTADLDGDLIVTLLPSYTPVLDDTFDIVTAASVNGTFATVDLPDGFDVEYEADRVVLRVIEEVIPCPSDVDDSGAVDVSDLLAVLAAWGPCIGCPEDTNDDDVVDVSDLLAILADWGACE